MKSKTNYIGINQRVPFDVLDEAIQLFLKSGPINRAYIIGRMQEYNAGINRATKAATYLFQILNSQEKILDLFKKDLKDSDYQSLRIEERKVFCLCLICLKYPITYDLLVALAQTFKVQDQINKRLLIEKVKFKYGGNRTVDVAIDALVPMIIELNTIIREKVGLYSKAMPVVVKNKFISELIIYTDISLSGSKSILSDDLAVKPWFSYFEIDNKNLVKFNVLIERKESVVGKGYLYKL